ARGPDGSSHAQTDVRGGAGVGRSRRRSGDFRAALPERSERAVRSVASVIHGNPWATRPKSRRRTLEAALSRSEGLGGAGARGRLAPMLWPTRDRRRWAASVGGFRSAG